MKKIILLFAMALIMASSTAVAQTWIGGNINYTTAQSENDDFKSDRVHQLSFAPEVGYNINDRWAVAASLGYAHNSYGSNINNTYSFSPYVRYTYYQMGNLGFFADGVASYAFSHTQGDEYNSNVMSVALCPGISLKLNDRFGLVSRFGGLQYAYSWYDDTNSNQLAFRLGSDITFGLYINL